MSDSKTPRTDAKLDELGRGPIIRNDMNAAGWSSQDFNSLIAHSKQLEMELGASLETIRAQKEKLLRLQIQTKDGFSFRHLPKR